MFYVFSKSPVVESGKKLIIEKKLTGTTFPQLLSVIHEKYKKKTGSRIYNFFVFGNMPFTIFSSGSLII